MSSSNSRSPDCKSGVYTFKLYFYDEVDNESAKKDYSMTNDELLGKLGKLIDTSEEIEQIWYYTHPLTKWQLYKGAVEPDGVIENLQGNLHHAYIVFGTKNWWWSVEKNDACVAIQRSKKFEFVRDKYYRGHRQTSWFTWFTGISYVKKKTGQSRTVEQLLEHIVARDYVNQKYHFLTENCQNLADKIYAYL